MDWVRIAMMCELVGCLPNAGGMLDQLEHHVKRMEQVYSARTKWQEDKPDESKNRSRQDSLKERAAQLQHSTEDLKLI